MNSDKVHLPDYYTQCTKWGYKNCWSIYISNKIGNLSTNHYPVEKIQNQISITHMYLSFQSHTFSLEKDRAVLTGDHARPPKWL